LDSTDSDFAGSDYESAHSAHSAPSGFSTHPAYAADPAHSAYSAHSAPLPRLVGPCFESDPTGLYADLRRRYGGVAPVLLEGGVPAWLVIGYHELRQVTSNPGLFARDSRRWNAWGRIPADWPLLPMIGYEHPSVLSAEGDAHKRRAGMISEALSGVDAYELRADAERFADRLVDSFCGSGRADLIAQYAHPLPLLVLARILGIDGIDGPDCAEGAEGPGGTGLARVVRTMMYAGADALGAQLDLRAPLQRLSAAKHGCPGSDVTSRMVHHRERYTDEELAQDLMVLMAAGHQPTAAWIGNTLRLMLTDERFAAAPSSGRRSVCQAMTEVLWRDAPIQNFAGRYATGDVRLGEQRICAGDLLVLSLAGANSDPSVHPGGGGHPGAESGGGPDGDSRAHFSFSHGDHRCPYPAQDIATAVARAGVEVLLDRIPDVRLDVPVHTLTWRPSPWLRALTALPVAFAPVVH
jgi:cytochrome P450